MNKKGQVFEQFGSVATGIAALAILLVIAFLIMSQGKEQVVELLDSSTTNDITLSGVTVEAFYEFEKCVEAGSGLTITAATNDTQSGTPVGSGNWTESENAVNFSNKDTLDKFDTSFNVNYTCKLKEEAYNGTSELQNATDGIPTWIPIIVIVFIGVILLGLVALLKRTNSQV